MMDSNFGNEIDDDFEVYETEIDSYVTEVDNKEWINSLLEGIDLD